MIEVIKYFLSEWGPPIMLVAIAAGCFTALGFGMRKDALREQSLIAECEADGRKHYECVAMFQAKGTDTVIVPMPVYAGR